jgi:DNA-3-methyladenine glycosylase
MQKLTNDFFHQSPLKVAKNLLGFYLIHESPQGITAGRIIETEAYGGKNDPASHAYKGMTPRNYLMFGEGGFAYVYFIYGMHECFNVTCDKEGRAAAILIRALEPIQGIELMKKRRQQNELSALCSGPAKLCQAMGINRSHNALNLRAKPLYLTEGTIKKEEKIYRSPRIGISKAQEKLWRFYCSSCATKPPRYG